MNMKMFVLSVLVILLLLGSLASAEMKNPYLGEGVYLTEEFACQMTGIDFLLGGYMAIQAETFWYFTYRPSTETNGVFLWMIVEGDGVESMAEVMANCKNETSFVLSSRASLAYIPYANEEVEGWEIYTDLEDFKEAMLQLA